MIIGIESAYGDRILSGKPLSFDVLTAAVKDILGKHSEHDFVAQFCARFGYKELPYSEGYCAYIIDLDTHMVLVTAYTFPDTLDGAKVLYYTTRGNFEPVYYPGGEIAHNVFYLAICRYDNDSNYYIFHCDENLEVVADDCLWSLELCMRGTDQDDIVWHKKKES